MHQAVAARASIDPAYRIPGTRTAESWLTPVTMSSQNKYTLFPPARFGAVAFIAIGAALFSLVVTFSGHPVWGLVLAALGVPVGLVGLIRALSPEVRGGVLSFLAILLSAIGVIAAILVMVFGVPAWAGG